mgnify:CR=1 FL=1
MGKNNALPKIKRFKHLIVFKEHVESLLKVMYPNEVVSENDIICKSEHLVGVSAIIHPYHIYIDLNEAYINNSPIFKKKYMHKLDAINTTFDYRASSKRVYVYPKDRDEFPDTPLGMEQRAAFFVLVLELSLKHIIFIKE